LAQSYADLEVLVVIDGPDAATSNALATIREDRLRVIALPRSLGAASARNIGVDAAQGDWIAFLDDDDEWLPDKTTLQMERARNSVFPYPIVSSQLFLRGPKYDLIWPRKPPFEPLSEYLLARNSWSFGDGVLSTITLFFPKDLFRIVPFTSGLRRYQDQDWVLRASREGGAGIEFIPRPLAVAYQDETRASITTVPDWRTSANWIESVRGTITARAYASFLATTVASQAARQGDWSAWPLLLRTILGSGAPNVRDLIYFLGIWFLPRELYLAVRKAGW